MQSPSVPPPEQATDVVYCAHAYFEIQFVPFDVHSIPLTGDEQAKAVVP